jgi:hypothetical protein
MQGNYKMKQFLIKLWNGIKEIRNSAAKARLKQMGH